MTTATSRHTLWAALPLALVAVLVLLPVAMVVAVGWGPDAVPVLTAPSTWRVIGYTTFQAVLSTIGSLAMAMPAAYALYRLRVPGPRVWLAILTIPFILPTVVVGLAFRELLPFPGTTAAIVVAHIFFNVGLSIRVIGSLWGHLDPRLEQVGASLGLNPLTNFRRITLPLLAPAISAAAILVLLFTFTSFGVVLVLGDPALPTIEVDIYTRAMQRLDLTGAAVLALVQFVIVAAAIVVSSIMSDRLAVRQRLGDDEMIRRIPQSPIDRVAAGYVVVLAVAVAVPMLSLVVRSLRVSDGWGFAWYAEAVSPTEGTTRTVSALSALTRSLEYAGLATVIAVVLGVIATAGILAARRRGRWLDGAVMLPLGVSAVTVGLGLLLLSVRGPIDLRGWTALVPLGQALVALPIVVRVLLPVLRSTDPRMRQVAATLGAGPLRAWWAAEGPIAVRATAVGAAFAAAVSLGEFGATAFLVRLETPTAPVQIVRLLGRPGEANIGVATALAVLLLLLTVIIVSVAERIRPRRGGGW